MSKPTTEYLEAVSREETRPLTKTEQRRVERSARASGISYEAAEAGYRRFLAYWAGSAGASIERDVRAGRSTTIVAGSAVAS